MLNLKVYTIDGSCTRFTNLPVDITHGKENMSGGGDLFIVLQEKLCTIFRKDKIIKIEMDEVAGIYRREISAEETQGDTVNIGLK